MELRRAIEAQGQQQGSPSTRRLLALTSLSGAPSTASEWNNVIRQWKTGAKLVIWCCLQRRRLSRMWVVSKERQKDGKKLLLFELVGCSESVLAGSIRRSSVSVAPACVLKKEEKSGIRAEERGGLPWFHADPSQHAAREQWGRMHHAKCLHGAKGTAKTTVYLLLYLQKTQSNPCPCFGKHNFTSKPTYRSGVVE